MAVDSFMSFRLKEFLKKLKNRVDPTNSCDFERMISSASDIRTTTAITARGTTTITIEEEQQDKNSLKVFLLSSNGDDKIASSKQAGEEKDAAQIQLYEHYFHEEFVKEDFLDEKCISSDSDDSFSQSESDSLTDSSDSNSLSNEDDRENKELLDFFTHSISEGELNSMPPPIIFNEEGDEDLLSNESDVIASALLEPAMISEFANSFMHLQDTITPVLSGIDVSFIN